MLTLNSNIHQWVVTNLKFIFVNCLAILLVFTANAQLPGQLPVNIKAFKARVESGNKVAVFWITEYEKDNGYFDIERSDDGTNFKIVGRVAGVNTNGILTDYIFYDNNCLKGISFYRLKQVDVDTKFSYSPIERVKNSAANNLFVVYPNPATGNRFKFNILKNTGENIDVMIFDQCGKLQLKQRFINNNTNNISHHLPAGIYTVKINGKDFTETKKLVIQQSFLAA